MSKNSNNTSVNIKKSTIMVISSLLSLLIILAISISLSKIDNISVTGGSVGGSITTTGDMILGVPRSKQAKFSEKMAQNLFLCQDGSGTLIHWSYVNDNYCDCIDGSDEPGTSACSSVDKSIVNFYCLNKGHRGSYIKASRVGDGICDCCDGSDEIDFQKCPNTCKAEAKDKLASMAEEIKTLEEGAIKKKEYIKQAEKNLEIRTKELSNLESELEERKKSKDEVENEKLEQENILDTMEKEYHDHMVEDIGKRFAINSLDETGIIDLEDKFNKSDRTKKELYDILEKLVLQRKIELNMIESSDVEENPEENDDNKQHKDENKEFLDDDEWPDDVMDDYSYADHDEEYDNYQDGEDMDDNDLENISSNDEEVVPPTEEEEKLLDLFDGLSYELPKLKELQVVMDKFNDIKHDVKHLELKVKDITGKLDRDYGEELEFWFLEGKCFEFNDKGKYVYEMCPFDKASQKESGSSTNIGKWTGIGTKDDGTKVMHFENGQKCWNGPKRSLEVRILCGNDNKLINVDEPSTCRYTIDFATPIGCDLTKAEELKFDLQDDDEEEIHDEL